MFESNQAILDKQTRKNKFSFKQFEVHQQKSAMKVGTDGALLGAWVEVEGVRQVLDIGTGTGLIAIMIAQRNQMAFIHGIDIDSPSANEAKLNMDQSPWASRLNAECISIQDYASTTSTKYDLIVSNPPFFLAGNPTENESLAFAKHAITLNFDQLIETVNKLLLPEGRLGLILPAQESKIFIDKAKDLSGLNLIRLTEVKSKAEKPIERCLMEFSRVPSEIIVDQLVIQFEQRNNWTPEFKMLMKDFYLRI